MFQQQTEQLACELHSRGAPLRWELRPSSDQGAHGQGLSVLARGPQSLWRSLVYLERHCYPRSFCGEEGDCYGNKHEYFMDPNAKIT